jgi:hypothetical protein
MNPNDILDGSISNELSYTMNSLRKNSNLRYLWVGLIILSVVALFFLDEEYWSTVIAGLISFIVIFCQNIWQSSAASYVYKVSTNRQEKQNQLILSLVNAKGEIKDTAYSIESIQKVTLIKETLHTGQTVLNVEGQKRTHEILMKDFLKVFPKYIKVNKYEEKQNN